MLRSPVLVVSFAALAPALAAGDCLDLGRDTAYVVAIGDHHMSCGNVPGIGLTSVKSSGREDSVWFRVDGQNWVIRDRAVVTEADRLLRQVWDLGEKQGALGAKQGKLGAEQGMLGAEQARIGMKQAAAALSAEPVDDVSERQAELGERQAELGRKQSALGEQQNELGKRMELAMTGAKDGLSRLLERAIKEGTAVRATRL